MVGSRRPALSTDCVYVTNGWGVHDDRWVAALRTLGHHPATISLTSDDTDDDLAAHLADAGRGPILAGPLDSVTERVVRAAAPARRIIGLSWGFDLPAMQTRRELDWLAALAGLIVDSRANADLAIAAGFPAQDITWLPWGIDLSVFTCTGLTADRRALGIPPGQRIVLSLRAHEDLYRVTDIVSAWARIAETHPDAMLVIGHSGSRTPHLRSLARVAGIDHRIVFIGTVEEEALAPLLRDAACYVSAAEVDGTSVTLLQAMACGAPIVVSDTPGNRGWITAQTGRLFPVGDVAALARQIDHALTQDNAARCDAAHALVQREADWARNVHRLEAALFARP